MLVEILTEEAMLNMFSESFTKNLPKKKMANISV